MSMTTTYVYEGPSAMAVVGLAIIVACALAIVGRLLNHVEDWWYERQAGPPGPVEEAVDGVPIEPAEGWPWPDGTMGVLYAGGWVPTGPLSPQSGETVPPTRPATDAEIPGQLPLAPELDPVTGPTARAHVGAAPLSMITGRLPLDAELDPELARIARGVTAERFGG